MPESVRSADDFYACRGGLLTGKAMNLCLCGLLEMDACFANRCLYLGGRGVEEDHQERWCSAIYWYSDA